MTTNAPVLAHSTLGASTAERWTSCPASVRLSKGIESKSSAYAEEGTRAHEVAAIRLNTGGWVTNLDPEMREAVQIYVGYIEDLRANADLMGAKHELFVEQRLDLSSVHPLMFGTADAVFYLPDEKHLHVIDYKHGAGIPVDVKENLQLQYYGLGAMLMLNRPVEKVTLTIVQPRCNHADGPVRSWDLHAFLMLDLAANLREYARKTEDPNAAIVPGEHCRFCPAAGICPGLARTAQEAARTQFAVIPSPNHTPNQHYEAERLAETLAKLDVIEDWAKSVREFAYSEAMRGVQIPGFKLVAKQARRKWHTYVSGETLALHFGGDRMRFCEIELRSPAEVEKLLDKPQKAELNSFVEKVSSGLALVPETDKRPAANLRDAKADFEKIEGPASDIFG
jgi:hypothetical protein